MRSGPSRPCKATSSSPPCSAPHPSSLQHLCSVRPDRCFPCPSFPPCAGDVQQCLSRPDSSSGLGPQELSILRHLMTNNVSKRVFLQSHELMREWEVVQGCHCAPHQHVHSPLEKANPLQMPHANAEVPPMLRASQAVTCKGPACSRQHRP